MSDAKSILEHIHGLLGDKQPEVVGAMKLDDQCLSVLDGRATIRAEIIPRQGRQTSSSMVHAHVITTLSQIDGESIDPIDLPACVVGIDPRHAMALFDVSRVWVDLVAGPIWSLVAGKPVWESKPLVLTDQEPRVDRSGNAEANANDAESISQHCVGYVGPIGFRFAELPSESKIMNVSLFEDVMSLASPRRVHLAKLTLDGAAGPQWRRTLEINGHDATFHNDDWQRFTERTHGGIAIQFAVLNPSHTDWVHRRQAIDDAILKYVQLHCDETRENIDDWFRSDFNDPSIDVAIKNFVPSACARLLMHDKIQRWPDEFYFVRAGGQIEGPRTLLSQVAFARTIGLQQTLFSEPYLSGVKNIALGSSQFNAINAMLHRGGKIDSIRVLPLIIPLDGATEADLNSAAQKLVDQIPKTKKPWWRRW